MRLYGGHWNSWIFRAQLDGSNSVKRAMSAVIIKLSGDAEGVRAANAIANGYPRIGDFDNISIKSAVSSVPDAFDSLRKNNNDVASVNPKINLSTGSRLFPVRFIWRGPDVDIEYPEDPNGAGDVWASFFPDNEVLAPETKPIDLVPPIVVPAIDMSIAVPVGLFVLAIGAIVILKK